MTAQNSRERRRRIMERSIALGHCICDPRKPCPCDTFKNRNICECAGERVPPPAGPVRLTETVRNPGCASKIAKTDLSAALAGLPEIDDERVLVGRSAGDDAGVVRFGPDGTMILTVDVFAPSVDDPAMFGRIAAANSLSDIWAMGGTPLSALSIIGFPIHTLPREAMHEILRGGIDTMAEAGVPVVGGHSINDEEVKCGFAVVGSAPEGQFYTNAGARPGDVIVLTKPLGIGIIAFARQIGRADDAALQEITASMIQLNRVAGEALRTHGAHAATDVTGFSLLGHLGEVVRHSGVVAEIDFDSVPLFEPVRPLARADVIPGGVERNREALPEGMVDFGSCTEAQQAVLLCPETSGGILAFLPEEKAGDYIATLQHAGIAHATAIGQVLDTATSGHIRIRTQSAGAWSGTRKAAVEENTNTPTESCCASAPVAKHAGGDCCSDTPVPITTENAGESCCSSTPPQSASASSCCSPSSPEASGPDHASPDSFLAPLPNATAEAFRAFNSSVFAPGALDLKTKKLMALALSVVTKCAPCVKINTRACREAGASDAEIGEAVAVGIAFGGASVNMFYETLRRETE